MPGILVKPMRYHAGAWERGKTSASPRLCGKAFMYFRNNTPVVQTRSGLC